MNSKRQRKIIHIDMDAFYASIEQRENPELKGRPLVVGGSPNSRGVVATCSYEARKFGIHSAMPSARAFQLCPQAVFVRPRMALYRDVSRQVQALFKRYTDIIEPLSLDEAYLDVTHSDLCQGSASRIAEQVRDSIFQHTGLTASAGVSYNKFLAKIASDINKPNGQFVITPQQGEAFVRQLPIGRFYGVGKVTEAKMHGLGVFTGNDLHTWTLTELTRHFGKAARYYFDIVRGDDERPVVVQRVRKSFGSEITFASDLVDVSQMLDCLMQLGEKLLSVLASKQLQAHTLTIKVKYHDFQLITRSVSRDYAINSLARLQQLIPQLLAKTDVHQRAVRLLGVAFSGFESIPEQEQEWQLDLFDV